MFTFIMSLLGGVATILASKLIDNITTGINEEFARSGDLSQDTIISTINKLVSAAKTKGQKAMTILAERLGSINLPIGASPAVKELVISRRRELNSALNNFRNDYTAIENKINNAETRAQSLAYQTPEYRRNYGKEDMEAIKKDLGAPEKEVDQLIKGVEQYVK